MRISDWSSDVCSSDLGILPLRSGLVPWPPEVDRVLGDEGPVAVQDDRRQLPVFIPSEPQPNDMAGLDRKSVVSGKRVAVRVDLGGRRIIKKKNRNTQLNNRNN